MSTANLVRTPIVDRNGRLTTVLRKPSFDGSDYRAIPVATKTIQTRNDTLRVFSFSPEEVYEFTNGDCYLLAIEIHKLVGWEMVAIGYDQGVPDANGKWTRTMPEDFTSGRMAHCAPEDFNWFHMANRLPNGSIVDIEGIHHEAAAVAKWMPNGNGIVRVVDDAGFFAEVEGNGIIDPEPRARQIIELVNSDDEISR
jgi:hypothetical protein